MPELSPVEHPERCSVGRCREKLSTAVGQQRRDGKESERSLKYIGAAK